MKKLLNKLKRAHKSLTIWFNAIGAGVLSVLIVEPTLITFLNEHNLSYILIIGNLLLRLKTNADLSSK